MHHLHSPETALIKCKNVLYGKESISVVYIHTCLLILAVKRQDIQDVKKFMPIDYIT